MQPDQAIEAFRQLKSDLVATYQKRNPDCADRLADWKVKTIEDFQDHLMELVNDKVSTKWFYTHLKGEQDKLPRIDVLNMLSRYVGASDWESYSAQYTEPSPVATAPPIQSRAKRPIALIVVIVVVVLGAGFAWFGLDTAAPESTQQTYSYCFVDADLNYPLKNVDLALLLLKEGESAMRFEADSNGCVELTTEPGKITFLVEAAYYQSDTLTRMLDASRKAETVELKADDYALMIKIFSSSDIKDWQRRRDQLDQMFAEEAQIFQVNPSTMRGMEMYNKQEFIDKLTMPVNSLRDIQVLETQYDEGRIIGMRFTQEQKN